MGNKVKGILVAFACFLLCGCQVSVDHAAGTVVKREDHPDVVYFDDADEGMNAAMAQGRATLNDFIDELAQPAPTAKYGVKARFDQGSRSEFIWLDHVRYAEGVFEGTVGNEGVDVPVHIDQRVSVPRDRIVDWLVVQNGRFRGGYTVRFMRDHATPQERQRMDEQFGALPE